MVDAGDLKSPEPCSCGFESHRPHHVVWALELMRLADRAGSEAAQLCATGGAMDQAFGQPGLFCLRHKITDSRLYWLIGVVRLRAW